MRQIEVEDGLKLRFPGRGSDFNEGVEIGLLAAHLARGSAEFELTFAFDTLEQARALASGMGYRVHLVRRDEDRVTAMFLRGGRRPRLTLVSDLSVAS